jgi:hypothetical protein
MVNVTRRRVSERAGRTDVALIAVAKEKRVGPD